MGHGPSATIERVFPCRVETTDCYSEFPLLVGGTVIDIALHPLCPDVVATFSMEGNPLPGEDARLWRDPLFSPADRFPLGPPRGIMDNCYEGPSGPATRPFSLRHVVAGARLDTPSTWRYTYCHERQVALVYDEDGSLIPLLRHTKPGPTPSPGTSATPDGNPRNPPAEEMLAPDYGTD